MSMTAQTQLMGLAKPRLKTVIASCIAPFFLYPAKKLCAPKAPKRTPKTINVVRLFGWGAGITAGDSALFAPKPPKMDGTTEFAISRKSAELACSATATPPPGRGGGAALPPAETAAGGCVPAATNSGAETLNFGSSAGDLLQPKIVQPQFSA